MEVCRGGVGLRVQVSSGMWQLTWLPWHRIHLSFVLPVLSKNFLSLVTATSSLSLFCISKFPKDFAHYTLQKVWQWVVQTTDLLL